MGLLEDILARAQYAPAAANWPTVAPPGDEWAAIEAETRRANETADRRNAAALKRSAIVPPSMVAPGADSAGVQLAMDQAPAGTGVPFSTQAGMLAPPVTINAPTADAAPSPPLPAARPAEADLPLGTPTDVSAASRAPVPPVNLASPQAAVPVAPPPVAEPSMFGRLGGGLMNGLERNSNVLLAMGAGFAGAPNIGQAISRASAAAIPAHAADVKQQLTLQAQTYGTKALVDAGVPIQQAIAAQGDPDLKKALIQNYITDRKNEIKSVKSKDAFGNETERLYAVNPFDLTSKEISPATAAAGRAAEGAAAGGKNATYAEGVTSASFDHTKVGDDYLGQFSPEVQAGVKAYLRGDSLPTGRQQQAQVIKQIAQKYGDDVGIPANDQAYYQRKNFVNSLGNTNTGVGMQVKGFQQGLEHLTELSTKLEKLGNWNGLGIAPLAHGANYVRGQSVSQADVRKSVDAAAQALAGEIGKLYSGSTGGGVHERAATKALFGTDLSGPEMAGALESTLELMRGGLRTIEQRRDELFPGAEKPRGADFLGSRQQQAMEKVEATIKRLRGGETAPAAAPAPPAAAPKPGRYVYDLATGKMVPAP